MAILTPSPLVQDLHGSAGSVSFVRWRKGVNIVKARSTKIGNDPSTVKQQRYRDAVAYLNGIWWTGLTKAERDLWESIAKIGNNDGSKVGGTRSIIKGNTKTGTGYHAFLTANLLRASLGIDVTADPLTSLATTFRRPGCITNFAVSWDGTPNFYWTFTWTTPAEFIEGDQIRIWVYDPTQVCHRQLLKTTDADDDTLNSAQNISGAAGAQVPFYAYPVGSVFSFQADVVNEDTGIVSNPSETIEGTIS